jgi:hypothetical protein
MRKVADAKPPKAETCCLGGWDPIRDRRALHGGNL